MIHARHVMIYHRLMDQPDSNAAPTVERSLEVLSQARRKAVGDLAAVGRAIEMARGSSAETSALTADADRSRALVIAATRAVDELRRVDESLTAVVKTLEP